MILRASAAALCLVALPACALSARSPGADNGDVYALAAVDRQPVPRGCEPINDPLAEVEPGAHLNNDPRYGGWVELRYVVRPDGTVDPASVRASGANAKALRASQRVRTCIYEPALVGGEPVAVRMSSKVFVRG